MIKFDSPEYNVTYPTERFETVVSYVYDENKIDINNASAEELTALFNVGEKRAELIIAHRKKIGGFYYIEELLDVEKLPDSVYYKNKDIITINEYTEAFD